MNSDQWNESFDRLKLKFSIYIKFVNLRHFSFCSFWTATAASCSWRCKSLPGWSTWSRRIWSTRIWPRGERHVDGLFRSRVEPTRKGEKLAVMLCVGRNCLLGPGYVVKVADMAMASDLYRRDYCDIGGRPPAPIRWLPWESILLVSTVHINSLRLRSRFRPEFSLQKKSQIGGMKLQCRLNSSISLLTSN